MEFLFLINVERVFNCSQHDSIGDTIHALNSAVAITTMHPNITRDVTVLEAETIASWEDSNTFTRPINI